jgi:hypothetical protein
LISAPILGYANFELPFEIHTDASGTAFGAVLYQEQDGFKKIISYASRGLTKSEKHYRHQISEWLADMAELPDKSSVITNKSKETSDIFRVDRLWPIYYFLRFGWINLDTSFRYNIHQVEILEQHKKDLHVQLDHWDFMNSTEYPLA